MKRPLLVAITGLSLVGANCSEPARGPTSSSVQGTTADRDVAAAESGSEAGVQTRSAGSEIASAPSLAPADKDEPEEGSKCSFNERDPAERPSHYVPANRGSNIIFYQPPGGPLWSDADPDRALAELTKNDLIVAARAGKQDLWIRPIADMVTFEAGKYRLACY